MGNTMNYILNKKQKETITEEQPIAEETKEITAAMLLVPAALVPAAMLDTVPALPYRTITKDVFNEKYAINMKTTFIHLPSALRESFQTFTQGLMSEPYIARNDLLNAIDDFYSKNILKCDNTNGYWTTFSAHAFNCRTYQPM